MPDADFLEILRTLHGHDVEFVVVGGVCAVLHGAPVSTFDLDIVHARNKQNVAKLERALTSLDATYREAEWRRLKPDATRLRSAGHHLLLTRCGPLDVLGAIVGGRGFEDLIADSDVLEIDDGLDVRILSLAALIAIKEELDRDRDRAVLAILRRTLAEQTPESEPPIEEA